MAIRFFLPFSFFYVDIRSQNSSTTDSLRIRTAMLLLQYLRPIYIPQAWQIQKSPELSTVQDIHR